MPPSTRSASASLASPIVRAAAAAASQNSTAAKRTQPNGVSTPGSDSGKSARNTRRKVEVAVPPAVAIVQEASSTAQPKFDITDGQDESAELVVRPELSFDLEEAKRHLRSVDQRFHALFERLPCKPFEEETDLNPFRALCSSILGQQISWLAARSITHKFIRLVAFPELPEKPGPTGMTTLFPTPKQVANAPLPLLRQAGLSQRKAEYVQDLATRFADGRLSAKKLLAMSDEEVMKTLCDVRGIGPWTAQMFEIFTLRRPNVMPHGDLGIQKGLVRWHTQVNPNIHVRKLPNPQSQEEPETATKASPNVSAIPTGVSEPPATPKKQSPDRAQDDEGFVTPATPSSSSVPAPFTPQTNGNELDMPLMTPRTEEKVELPPFPDSQTLTRDSLRARLKKKVKGNNYLTPQEMDELTAAWQPYRSIGVWYLWSLADEDTSFG